MPPVTTGKVIVDVESALLLGGHTAPAGFADASTALLPGPGAPRPILPASALRGALRDALVRLLRGRQGTEAACEPWSPCATRGQPPCPACRIFGAPGTDRPDLDAPERVPGAGPGFAGITIGDALPTGGDRVPVTVRHGVSVDRRTGHAASGRLFQREVAEAAGRTFEAPFSGTLTPADLALFQEAAHLVDAVGNSRSRGLGAVTVRVLPEAPQQVASAVAIEGKVRAEAILHVEARSDLHLGDFLDDGNLRSSTDLIPGSALRGAITWALVHAGLDRLHPAAFQAFVAKARFSDALPAAGDASPHATPAPRTVVTCARDPEEWYDTILTASLLPRILERGGRPLDSMRCPRCQRPLRPDRPLIGVDRRGIVDPPASRLVTRLALDPATRSHASGLLHSRRQVLAGARFVGTVSGIDPGVLDLLGRLTDLVQVGGLRSKGLGRILLRFRPFERQSLDTRLARFQQDADGLVPAELRRWLGLPDGRWVEVVARTPLSPPPDVPATGVATWLGGQLFPNRSVEVVGSFCRSTTRSGWEDRSWESGRTGPLGLIPVLEGGSTWLFRFGGGAPDPVPLATAETAGVGQHTDLGLGRLSLCPSVRLARFS